MKKTTWVDIARRGKAHAVLFIHNVMELYRLGYVGKMHGLNWNPKTYRQFDHARWFGKEDAERYQEFIESDSRKKDALLAYGKKYERCVMDLKMFADRTHLLDIPHLSNAQLITLLRRWKELNMRMWSFAYDYIFLNKFMPDLVTSAVSAKIPDQTKLNELLGVLFETDQPSEVRREKQALLAIAITLKKQKRALQSEQAQKLMQMHIQKFAHLGFYYFRGAAYTQQDIANRLKEYINLSPAQVRRAQEDFKKQARNKSLTSKIIRELKLNKETARHIRIIKRWGSLSNFADESYGHTVLRLWPLWTELERRLRITHTQMLCLSCEEIIQSLAKGKVSPSLKQQIQYRLKDNAVILENGKTSILSGIKLQSYAKRELATEKTIARVEKLTGQSASPGKATGKVRLVFSSHDVKKVERGDILVASATNPTYVPAMERAGAIVTDEGGLLSHAAIVSRELKIPCVVGTGIATKAFEDGDIIEVDANTGLIKRV